MQRTDVMLAWDDCVIRFKIKDVEVTKRMLGRKPTFPPGWRLVQFSKIGNDPVVEFRVTGVPLHTDAATIRNMLNAGTVLTPVQLKSAK